MGLDWGLLWYDADGPMEDRVRRAATRYEEKYGKVPNVAFVHDEDVEKDFSLDDCMVLREPAVLKNHIWIGVRDAYR